MSAKEDIHKIVSTAGLLLIDAMVFHEFVALHNKEVPTLSAILSSSGSLKKSFEDVWQYVIQNINYEPVLKIAHDILTNMPASPVLDKALRSLAELAQNIASSEVLLKHDLFGRIYHRLLLGNLAKYYATYYTSIPAARLLARLLVNLPSGLNVEDVPPKYNGENLRIVDFACGSGTLLSAIYKEIEARYRIESKDLRIDDLHKYLIEEGIWGFDVLHHAIHLAATSLSLHNPVPVNGSRLYVLRLGERKYLGSINFLSSSTLGQDMVLSGPVRGQKRISTTEEKVESISLPNFHICIMNPPFTRSVGGNLLFGSLPEGERKQLQEALRKLLRKEGLEGIGQAGLGAVFVFLADKYLQEGGRLGLVLPRAFLSGVSWKKVREMLLSKYHIEYIITSYETNNWNFSENTDLSEILLVARKRRSNEEPSFTFFVNLWRKPSGELESIYLGSQLRQLYDNAKPYDIENTNTSPYRLRLHGRDVGEVYSAKLRDSDFGVYNFFSQMELNRVMLFLRRGMIYLPGQGVVTTRIPLTTLPELGGKIGPDRRQVHDAFSVSDVDSTYKAFWGYDSSVIKTISQKPNAYLKPKSMEKASKLWGKRGKFLIVERAGLRTYTVLAVYLDEGVLSNVWWTVSIDDDTAKILATWINSTFGFLLLSSIAEVTHGPWVEFKKERLQEMPVLDVNKLGEDKKNALLQLYDKIKLLEFKSLSQEFKEPSTRRIIDEEISKILGLELSLDTLYSMLSKEPMIGGLRSSSG